jgi:hypothetical protein
MIYSIVQALANNPEPVSNGPRSHWQKRLRANRKPLRLLMNGRFMEFKSTDDFSFAVECRTGITSARYHALFERETQALWEEAQSIKAIEKNLVDILEDALCDGSPCGPAMRSLGLQNFSADHGWRDLIEQLVAADDRYDAYKRLALIKYMQYLGARQEVIRLIFALKNRQTGSARTTSGQRRLNGAAVLETMVFDISASDNDSLFGATSLQRLPRGEAVKLYALPGHAIDIRLAKHAFRLVNDNGWVLCEADGRRHALADVQTMVGRGRDNDIRLDAQYNYLSRRHMIVEPQDDHVILVTDLSSHGTFAPAMQTEQIAV